MKMRNCIFLCNLTLFFFSFAFSCYALNLDTAKAYFLKGDYASVINECENILATAGSSSELEELYYILALSYMKQGNLLRASDIFEIILKEFKDSKFREKALMGLGDVSFLKLDYDNAQNQYKQVLEVNPNSKLKSIVLFRLAQCSIKKGNWQEAKGYLDALKKDYPLSFEARLAKDLAQHGAYFTIQVGAFSKTTNANNLCAGLNDKGYPAYVQEVESEQAKTFRVRVGKLATLAQAKELEKKLIDDGYPTKIYP
jgi:outer membrane protein assembly factor BamD (BamD/ComL family)